MRVLALEDQIVRIEWRLADGTTHVQEVMCPPKDVRDVRDWERRVSLPSVFYRVVKDGTTP
jgi:hypothetical protein